MPTAANRLSYSLTLEAEALKSLMPGQFTISDVFVQDATYKLLIFVILIQTNLKKEYIDQ
jgi:hypothetical protein